MKAHQQVHALNPQIGTNTSCASGLAAGSKEDWNGYLCYHGLLPQESKTEASRENRENMEERQGVEKSETVALARPPPSRVLEARLLIPLSLQVLSYKRTCFQEQA